MDDFSDDFYVIDEGEPEQIGLGHHGEDNQEVAPARKRRGGFQTAYEPRFAELARVACKFGATDEELAEEFRVHRVTIYRWRREHPEFAAAVKLAKEEADDRVERSLYSRANGYDRRAEKLFSYEGKISRGKVIEHVPADPKAAIYWLNNRRREKWRHSSELTGANGAPLIPREAPSPKELARWCALILTRGAETIDAEVQYLPAPNSEDDSYG
jgi:hypothetical protein